MRTIFLLAITFCFTTYSYAQPESGAFTEIEKLLNKARGQIIPGLFDEDMIGNQTFKASEISVPKTSQGSVGLTMTHSYSKINWSGITYSFKPTEGNNKVLTLLIEFKDPVAHFYGEKGNQGFNDTASSAKLFFLAKDKNEMERLFKKLSTN